jgi:SAM-dependent methyltransferase
MMPRANLRGEQSTKDKAIDIDYGFAVNIVEHPEVEDHSLIEEYKQLVHDAMRRMIEINKGFETNGGIITEMSGTHEAELSKSNPALHWAYYGKDNPIPVPQMDIWRSIMLDSKRGPLALENVYDPGHSRLPDGNLWDPNAQIWLTYLPISIALNERGRLEKSLLKENVKRAIAQYSEAEVLALGVGSAKYLIDGAKKLQTEGARFSLTAIDLNDTTIKFALKRARDFGLRKKEFNAFTRDLLSLSGFVSENAKSVLGRFLINGSVPRFSLQRLPLKYYDLVTEIGFAGDYLPIDNFNYDFEITTFGMNKHGSMEKSGFRQHIADTWKLVKPGGRLLTETLSPYDVHDKKQQPIDTYQFLNSCIRWIGLRPKSRDVMLQAFRDAGLEGLKRVQIHHAPSGMPVLYELEKQLCI